MIRNNLSAMCIIDLLCGSPQVIRSCSFHRRRGKCRSSCSPHLRRLPRPTTRLPLAGSLSSSLGLCAARGGGVQRPALAAEGRGYTTSTVFASLTGACSPRPAVGGCNRGSAHPNGGRGYAKATIRHFPKHLLRSPGEPPRPALPQSVQEDLEAYDKYDLDPQVRPDSSLSCL